MKSSRPQTLKGSTQQIINQIVKVVLPSDAVHLQSGRRPKKAKKKGPGKPGKPGKPSGKPGGPGKPGKPPGGPKPPDGFLSHNIHPDQPRYPSVFGPPTARPPAPPAFQPPASSAFEKLLLEKLVEAKNKTTPAAPPAPPAPPAVSPAPARFIPGTPTPPSRFVVSTPVKSTIRPTVGSTPLSDQLRGRSMMEETARILERSREARSRSRAGEIMAEEIPRPAMASSLLRIPSLSGAPNQANQPSVDVDGSGKEEMQLQPRAASSAFSQAALGWSPVQPSWAYNPANPAYSSSSSVVFPSYGQYSPETPRYPSSSSSSSSYEPSEEREEEEDTPYAEEVFSSSPPGGDRTPVSSSSAMSVDDAAERASRLEEATRIEASLMRNTGTYNPDHYTKKGDLRADISKYLHDIRDYIIQLNRPGTPLLPIPRPPKKYNL